MDDCARVVGFMSGGSPTTVVARHRPEVLDEPLDQVGRCSTCQPSDHQDSDRDNNPGREATGKAMVPVAVRLAVATERRAEPVDDA